MTTQRTVDALLDAYSARGKRLRDVRAIVRGALTEQPTWPGSRLLARRILEVLDTPQPKEM